MSKEDKTKTIKTKVIQIKLLPKQLEFMQNKSKELAYIGAMGSGKTRVLCYKALQHALIPNNLVILTRKTLAALKDSTLRTLLLPDGNLPPVLQQGSYEYNQSRNMINIHGGGSILTIGCDDPIRIRSINAGYICIDEAIELEEEEYFALKGRLRSTVDDVRGIALATNPASCHHWLYKRFYIDKDKDRYLITTKASDNHYLPKDYIEDLKKLTGTSYKRYFLGEFCSNSGAVYKEFNQDLHLKEINETEWTDSEYLICADIGFNDFTCILIVKFQENKVHICQEVYTNTLTPSEIGNKILELQQLYNADKVIIDPSAKGTIVEMEKMGIKVIKANNSIDEGIARVKEYFIKNQITISKHCVNLIRELDLYSYKDGTDKPEDKNNHSCDAIRYGIAEIIDSKGIYTHPTCFIDGIEIDDNI